MSEAHVDDLDPSSIPTFVKTPKQRIQASMMARHRFSLSEGGSRSAKTAGIMRQIYTRAYMCPGSRHFAARFHFKAAMDTLGLDTGPKILRMAFPGMRHQFNKTRGVWSIVSRNGVDTSEVWLGGTNDKERLEEALGKEFSTLFLNEASQMPYGALTLLRTRVAQNVGLKPRVFADCNPPGRSHWLYKFFHLGLDPEDGTPHGRDTAYLQMNPIDNLANLDPEYIEELASLPRRARERFLKGTWLDDVEGALWTDAMLMQAMLLQFGELQRIVIGVDPNVSSNPNSNETGIIPAGLDEYGNGVVLDDWTSDKGPGHWPRRVVDCYHHFGANCVVAEGNQGGELVKLAIQNIDPDVPVEIVHARVGKFARAEPISQLYELGRVAHAIPLHDLEEQLLTYIPKDENTKESPDRLDGLVWALTHLMLGRQGELPMIRVIR